MTEFRDNIHLPSDIFNFLHKNPSGEVLLTTSKGIYLQFSSRIFLLTDSAYGLTPIGIGLSRFMDFVTALSPKPGHRVFITNAGIHFPSGLLSPIWSVEQPELMALQILPEQAAHSARLLVSQCNERSLAAMAAPLLLDLPLSSAAENNPYCTRAMPILKGLLSALSDRNCEKVNDSVSHLLGLGIGLTPSMDDILLGMLYGLLRSPSQQALAAVLRQAIISHAPSRTNAISAAYLEAVASGGCFERLDHIIETLSSNSPINIAPLLEIGSSSGSEMLLGLLLATKIAMKG